MLVAVSSRLIGILALLPLSEYIENDIVCNIIYYACVSNNERNGMDQLLIVLTISPKIKHNKTQHNVHKTSDFRTSFRNVILSAVYYCKLCWKIVSHVKG